MEYPDWLDNVVLVKKANGKWRLCIDFIDSNRACSKDSFPLPRIDLIVDATAGHELLSFMDAFSGYNQIRMDPNDQEKTSFVTEARYSLLPGDALRVEEHSGHISKASKQNVLEIDWNIYGGIYR